jgi:hypothetical protein
VVQDHYPSHLAHLQAQSALVLECQRRLLQAWACHDLKAAGVRLGCRLPCLELYVAKTAGASSINGREVLDRAAGISHL